MGRWRASPLVVSLALWLSTGSVGGEQLPLKIYGAADGLASDRIHSILSDSHGFLWFGTQDGISLFDGYRFTSATGSGRAPRTEVWSILEGRDGTFWAATRQGIFHWDPAGTSKARPHLPEAIHIAAGRPADEVLSLKEDRSGGLWAGTRLGLYRIEKSSNGWRIEAAPLPLLEKNTPAMVRALLVDRDGGLWIGTAAGLFRRGTGGAIQRIHGPDDAPPEVRCLLEDHAGTIWVGHYQGLLEIPRAGPRSAAASSAFRPPISLAGSPVTSLFETSDGELWAACFGGLTEIAPDRTSSRNYTTAQGLSSLGLWSLAEDRNGNLWLGSDAAGVMRLARNGFRRLDARDGLTNSCVASLFEDRDGHPCAFTRGTDPTTDRSFVECFTGSRFEGQRPPVPPHVSFGWGWNQVAFQDRGGEWWFPTVAGLYRFPAVSAADLAAAAPRRTYTMADGLPSNMVYRLFEDSRGDLWVSVLSGDRCLALWDRRTDSLRSFSTADGVPAGDEPMSFAEDRKGAVWIGFRSAGLARYRAGRFAFFREHDGLPAGRIGAIHLDAGGRLWVASDAAGVARIERPEEDAPRFVRFGVGQGLSSDRTFSLTEDRWGRIYIGTARGLDRLDPRTGLVQQFTTDDGLARGDVETSLQDRQKNLWFGSCQGLSRLQPVAETPSRPPPIRITRVIADGVRQPLADLGAGSVRLPSLGSGSSSVQIDFVALDFAPGGRPRYQYLLEGIDTDWSAPTDQRSVVYGRLAAGRYRFRVRGVANDGSTGREPAQALFAILPPFWRRPEVVTLAVAVLAGLTYLLHRFRLKSALAVERVRLRVAADLHDDVGAGLSEIAILSDLAGQGGGGQSQSLVAEIGENARRLVDAMSDIVWSTDPRKDDLSSLAQRIGRFAATTLERRGIAWSLEAPEEFESVSLDPERRRELFLIVKEALTNVARHSHCRRASVIILRGVREIVIEIADDGVGFATSDAEASGGHGLANMRERARSLRGEIEIDSGPAAGTRVRVRIPAARLFRTIST